MQLKSVLKAIAVGLVTGALPGVVALIFGYISLQQLPEWVLDGIVFGLLIGVPCQLLGPAVGCRVRHYPLVVRFAAILPGFF